MGHSATLVDVTRRWGVRAAILLIAGIVFVVVLIVLTAKPASAATCDINGTAVTTLASQPECDALVALYTSTDGPNWDTNTGWNTPTDPCGWYGVTCDAGVTEVVLFVNSLTGPIPAEIGGLNNLTYLGLAHNWLTSLPPEIGDLISLESLDLYNNGLSSLPPEIGGLTGLLHLNLWDNRLSSLPSEVGGLTNLEGLDLGSNQLSSLPSEIGGLTSLNWLNLDFN
jgi:Leucine-rich repeat (LRR) protein